MTMDNNAAADYKLVGKVNIKRGLTEALLILFDRAKSKRDSIRSFILSGQR